MQPHPLPAVASKLLLPTSTQQGPPALAGGLVNHHGMGHPDPKRIALEQCKLRVIRLLVYWVKRKERNSISKTSLAAWTNTGIEMSPGTGSLALLSKPVPIS